MKILITGGTGALGQSLRKVFKNAEFPDRKEIDITSPESVSRKILSFKPDAVIHTAAYVDVRGCEENREKAWLTNVEGTQNIVNALKKLGNDCYLIHISTACVFAGENEKYYTENDVPSPKSFYSITKLCSEIVVRQWQNACIIRTNFAPKQQWKYPKAFSDRFGTYLFSDDVARGIHDVFEKKEKGEEIPEYRGLRVPHLSFSFDTHFDRTPALWLDHSQVYGGVGFGGGTFQRSKVTCYYHRYDHGINVSGKDEYPVLWAANDIWTVANFDQPVIKEVVDALATNRLRLSGWDKEESAFNIHKRDKAPLARFMSEQLKHYFG